MIERKSEREPYLERFVQTGYEGRLKDPQEREEGKARRKAKK